ncbi:MAG: sigma-70 family RNA polymerase sigma factor [Alphaproteobacteria bacterium]|nr:sigma-70 family RNA polymerase sigma factor [Alphaproteobacteria bacterium]NCQ88746.1 sigma-70 family RNA polymerase sigma factor [Alphaproteobacteria bacterium]NCT07331.1 sigma-70 family RNA polymerase sigma factor [Alphaproteobacteria bacterium]
MNENAQSDEALMQRIQQHDNYAFSILVRRHSDLFYRAAYKMVQNKEEAEDIVQLCFLKIWDRPHIWKEGKGASFKTWFYRVVINQCRDQFKKTKRHVYSDQMESVIDEKEQGDITLIHNEKQSALEKAIMQLPEKQKLAITLCFDEGITNKEAAQIIGVKLKALESLLMRAKENIKNDLYNQGFIEDDKKEKHA